MPRLSIQLVILAAVLLAIYWVALHGKSENILAYCCTEPVQQAYCEPECPETVEDRTQRPPEVTPRPGKPDWISDLTLRGFMALSIAGLLGFALGQMTASTAPSAADVTRVITAAGTARVTEATLHGVAGAPALLGRLQADAIAAVQRLLPPPQIWGILTLGVATILIFLFFLVPPTPL